MNGNGGAGLATSSCAKGTTHDNGLDGAVGPAQVNGREAAFAMHRPPQRTAMCPLLSCTALRNARQRALIVLRCPQKRTAKGLIIVRHTCMCGERGSHLSCVSCEAHDKDFVCCAFFYHGAWHERNQGAQLGTTAFGLGVGFVLIFNNTVQWRGYNI